MNTYQEILENSMLNGLFYLGLIEPYGIIYKATNLINGKVYIGQTINKLSERIRGHKKSVFHKKNNKKTVFHSALKSYGFNNFKWEIIDCGFSFKDLNKKEVYYIHFFNSKYNKDDIKSGYNLTDGGEGTVGIFVSDYTKSKLSEKTKGEKNTGSKLKEEQVIEIKLNKDMSNKELSKKYGINSTGINRIKKGISWGHILPELNETENKRLTKEEILEIKKDNTTDYKVLAKKFNLKSASCISRIKRGLAYKDLYPELNIKSELRKGDKLTQDQIEEIRNNNELSCAKLGKIFGVSASNINNIKNGKTGKNKKDWKQAKYNKKILNEEIVKEIRRLLKNKNGISNKEICDKYNISINTLMSIKNYESWKNVKID